MFCAALFSFSVVASLGTRHTEVNIVHMSEMDNGVIVFDDAWGHLLVYRGVIWFRGDPLL